ncbi:deoxynucleoside triphosphate triphosphohydrolase SAMHD1-like [Gambusia affinis]|uniref:deoxynucleoside triphosphate triphosphohydrolase SAMHD1-like n=1 Tax=Gambusia affinis TaxID=33528 RepID=UPI001CDB80B7|nr:deoxynucleoside triphosphate triphosphohydrolase SAMHD1-like [Gambusia affinis]
MADNSSEEEKKPTKVFNDPVHGTIELHPILVKIIDTPQFQRLRNIKQLGGLYYVYPGASHNRFEHSIGVAHLAGELLQTLKRNQPNLGIDERDILCVQIAGLCHDLGHGPFSHMFDQMFIPRAHKLKRREEAGEPGENPRMHRENMQTPGRESNPEPSCCKHEEASQKMFDHMVKENHLTAVMEDHGLVPQEDLPFIRELIDPPKIAEWPHHGRPREKAFLYEVVSNTRNKIDVDKWEYFARDCHQLGMQNSFDCHRLIKFARVCKVDARDSQSVQGEPRLSPGMQLEKDTSNPPDPIREEGCTDNGMNQICYRDKEVGNLYDMFHTRFSLHKRAYQHKVGKSIEWMITDAFLKADGHIKIEGKNGKMLKLSEAIDDMVAYTKLTDTVFDVILNSTDVNLQEARKILERIMQRNLYVCLGELSLEENVDDMEDMEEMKEMKNLWNRQPGGGNPDDYVLTSVTYNYGMKKKDPIKRVRFYNKQNPDVAFRIRRTQVSLLLPRWFEEKKFRIYTKRTNDDDVQADRDRYNAFLLAQPAQH